MDNEGREGNNMDSSQQSPTDAGKSSTTNEKSSDHPFASMNSDYMSQPYIYFYENFMKAHIQQYDVAQKLKMVREVKKQLLEELATINAMREEIEKFADRTKQI